VTRNEKKDGFGLEKLGFSHQCTDRITSHQDWQEILTPGKMMTDEILGTLPTVSIYGHSKKLQLPTSLAKTWILNESFWNKWHKANTREEVLVQRWVYLEEEPVWGNEVLREDMAAFLDEMQRNNKSLSLSLEELSSLNCNHLTTDDFIRGRVGFYTTLQGHECARMIKKARPPVPLHLLDHMIIPIHVGNNHWFPAHLDIKERQMTFLDSLLSYSSKCHARHEMLIWKFNRMAWERHVAKEFPPPNWHLSPVDLTRRDNWLPKITPVMAQVLREHQKATVQVVTEVVGNFIIEKLKRQGICLWQEDFFMDTSRQNWIGRSQPSQMPQQDSFHNNFQTALACGHYSIVSSMYAVRNWKLDFDQQDHIAGAKR